MDINKRSYKVPETMFFKRKHKKHQIIIGNTLGVGMEHYYNWLKKVDGNYKKIAAFTITLKGEIFQHYNPDYYSTSINMNDFDKNTIFIMLENEGWLAKNFVNGKLITWNGDSYNREEVYNSKWRGKLRWAPYSDEQIDSLIFICKEMCKKYQIPLETVNHNTKINNIEKKRGIYYRSNHSSNYCDVSPAFKFDYFKSKIEE